jgi:hypothetical protein
MRLIANILIAIVGSALASYSANARDKKPKDTLIFAAHLDKYKAPNAVESWRKLLDAKETRAVGNAITSFYDCPGCYSMVGDGINAVVPFPPNGDDFKGVIQAPAGYTVCHAAAKDPSLTCNGTLTGSYREPPKTRIARTMMAYTGTWSYRSHRASAQEAVGSKPRLLWNSFAPHLEIERDENAPRAGL